MRSAESRATILVVDDEPQVLAAMQDTLEDDFHVLTAASPRLAMKVIEREPNLSVIISDQRMPGETGGEFLSRAREASDATRILITGFADIDAVIAAVNDGKIFGYVSKPWDTAGLRIVVFKAVEHHTLMRELKEREQRFRQLAENIRDVFWMSAADTGKGIYVSPAYEEIWGHSRTALRDNPEMWIDAIHPDDRGKVRQIHADMKDAPRPTVLEYRVIRPDGSVRWVRERTFPVTGSNGQVYRIAGVAEDMTERKDAEMLLRQTNEKLSTLVKASPVAICMLDREAKVLMWNPAAEQLFGWTGQEIINQPYPLVSAAERANFHKIIDDAAHGAVAKGLEQCRARKDGSPVDYALWTTTLADPEGRPYAGLGMMADISERKAAEALLLQTNEKLGALINASPLAIGMLDRDANVLMWNPAAERMFGWSAVEVIGRPYPLIQESEMNQFRETFKRNLEGASLSGIELRRVCKDGSLLDVALWTTPLYGADGNSVGGLFIMADITERKAQQDKIARLTRIYAVLSGINSAIVRIHDRQALLDEACRIAVEHGQFEMAWILKIDPGTMQVTPVSWGGTETDVEFVSRMTRETGHVAAETGTVGRSVQEQRPVYCNDLAKEVEAGLARSELLRRGYRSVISLPLRPEGESFGAMVLYTKVPDIFDELELQLLTELASDISFGLEYISKEEQATYLAYHDPLTGLSNRVKLHERLGLLVDEAARDHRHLALLLLDIDRFKTINSTLGRNIGDALLRHLAERLTSSVGDAGMLARLGADQFAVILPDVRNANHAARLVEEQVLNCFSDPFQLGDQELRVAGKVGIALYPEDGTDADTLFRNAEAAVKKAKNSGDRYLFYTQEMMEKVAEKLAMENELRRALEGEEFVLYYQPKVELATGRISGAEALIRWQHPERGLVPPMDFIPLLEETGLILEVGEWALDRAASDYREWRGRDLTPPRIAVNVSTIQLKQKHFVARAEKAIGKHGDLVALDLEITESTIMENMEEDLNKLMQLKMAGLGIVVDDFGTGYSSLSYIARMPINALKIDRSFIVGMTTSLQSRLIVSTIVSLAHALSLKVVAEGVDSVEQLNILKDLECDEVQGFLFSKPLPGEEFVALLKRGSGFLLR